MTNSEAYILRENTNTSGIEQTARTVAEILTHYDIPHLFAGGLAVQEHGYARVTLDVDVIVPDVLEALEFLTADVVGPIVRVPKLEDRVKDRRNGVFIDILPAGKVLKHGCQVPFPNPTVVNDSPQLITLEQLISLKLDSFSRSPLHRIKDKADVVELIKLRQLPRDLNISPPVLHLYTELWDGLASEK